MALEKKEFRMTEQVYQRHANACAYGADASKTAEDMKKVNVIDNAWQRLGAEMGFDWRSVEACNGKTDRYFMATALTLEEQDAANHELGITTSLAEAAANKPRLVMAGDLKVMTELPQEGKAAPDYYGSKYLLVIEFKTERSLGEALKDGGVVFAPMAKPAENDPA